MIVYDRFAAVHINSQKINPQITKIAVTQQQERRITIKNKLLKKITAAALSLLLIAASAVTVLAKTDIGSGNVTTNDTTLKIPKTVYCMNSSVGNYYGPEITYQYTIAPVEPVANAVVEQLPVVIGPDGGVVLQNEGKVSFSSNDRVDNVLPGGRETAPQYLILKTDLTKFVSPGIYRYKITDETTTSALFAAGITRPDTYQTERYLDVYIKNKTSGGLEVAAYTLMKGNNITVTASDKDSGFNYDSESDEHTDIYRTFNIRIEKQVKGDMGDKTHPFPFTITINNKGKKYFCGTDINNTSESNVESMTQNLTHGQVFYIRGLCPQASVGYSETNDTIDTYKVKIEGKSDPSQGAWEVLVAESDVEANGIKTLTPGKVTNYETVNSETDVTNNAELTKYRDVQYTNTLNSVSPTGVIIRIVPFVILIAGAVVLLIVIRRIRAGKKDTRSI